MDAAHAATGPDTVRQVPVHQRLHQAAKGSDHTQRMLCANQQQMRQSMPVLADADNPPVLLDWLPGTTRSAATTTSAWCCYNGGTLYIDDGKPTPR